MTTTKLSALALVTLALAFPAVAAAQDPLPLPAKPIGFTMIASSTTTGPITGGWQILDNDTNYAMFFGSQMQEPPASPSYDPSKELAVAVTLGAQPTVGASVKVTRVDLVKPAKGKAYVQVGYVVAPAPDKAPAGIVAPYTVVKFPRQEGLAYNDVKFQNLSPGADKETVALLSGLVTKTTKSLTIADVKTKRTYTIASGPLGDAVAAMAGKTVTLRAVLVGKVARVTRLDIENTGTTTLSIVDKDGKEIGQVAPGQKLQVIGAADGKFVVLGLFQAGYVAQSAVATVTATPGLVGVIAH